jgi:hypothetical protein
MSSPLLPPHYALGVVDKGGYDNLRAETDE